MKRRPGPFRLFLAIVAFYIVVYGLGLSPRPGGNDASTWTPPAARARKPVPPDPEVVPTQPEAGVAFSCVPILPGPLQSRAPQFVRPETREWLHIVVHHSAGTAGNAAEFDRMHREENKWEFGLGYHFVVGNGNGSPAGGVEVGQRWIDQRHGAHAGAHATEYNQHGIGICVVGNYEDAEMPEAVYAGLRDLVVWLARRYSIPPGNVLPHRDVRGEPTACPGKRFPLDRLREDVREALR